MRLLRLAAIGLAVAGLLPGQMTKSVSAEVPFTFEMSGARLVPGDYELNLADGYVHVKHMDGAGGAFVIISTQAPIKGENRAWLTFNRYGDRYFLSEIRHPYSHYQIAKSRQERELVTSRVVAMQRVVIPARMLAD